MQTVLSVSPFQTFGKREIRTPRLFFVNFLQQKHRGCGGPDELWVVGVCQHIMPSGGMTTYVVMFQDLVCDELGIIYWPCQPPVRLASPAVCSFTKHAFVVHH